LFPCRLGPRYYNASVVTMGLGLDSIDGHIDYLTSVAHALSLS
jgi:hypothetical protein